MLKIKTFPFSRDKQYYKRGLFVSFTKDVKSKLVSVYFKDCSNIDSDTYVVDGKLTSSKMTVPLRNCNGVTLGNNSRILTTNEQKKKNEMKRRTDKFF